MQHEQSSSGRKTGYVQQYNVHVIINHCISRFKNNNLINRILFKGFQERWIDAMDLDFLVTGAAQGIGYEFSRFDLSTMYPMLLNITEHIIKKS